jgi:hypothetical protein
MRKKAMQRLPKEVVDKLAAYTHDGWWQQKIEMGFHHPAEKHADYDQKKPAKLCDKCHLDMVPFGELPESIRNLDLVAVGTVLGGLAELGYEIVAKKSSR